MSRFYEIKVNVDISADNAVKLKKPYLGERELSRGNWVVVPSDNVTKTSNLLLLRFYQRVTPMGGLEARTLMIDDFPQEMSYACSSWTS
jgi:hypothetical protein